MIFRESDFQGKHSKLPGLLTGLPCIHVSLGPQGLSLVGGRCLAPTQGQHPPCLPSHCNSRPGLRWGRLQVWGLWWVTMGPPITHPSAQGGGASRGLPHTPRSPAWVQLPWAGLKPDGHPAQGLLRPQKLQERH